MTMKLSDEERHDRAWAVAREHVAGLEDIVTIVPTTPLWLLADGSEPCAQTDPDLWFPEKGEPANVVRDGLCGSCPLKIDCMVWGIHREQFGTWGGLSNAQRRAVRSELSIYTPYIRSDEDALAAGTKSQPLAMTPRENAHRVRTMPVPPHVQGRQITDVELPQLDESSHTVSDWEARVA